MATKVILIRHAQTNWNLEKRYCGFVDIGLNQKGIRQAKKLHKRLKKNRIYKVYSSDRNKIYCFKPREERFFCFFFTGKKIIITSAYTKKKQKLNRNELKKAIQIRREYLN